MQLHEAFRGIQRLGTEQADTRKDGVTYVNVIPHEAAGWDAFECATHKDG